MFTGIIEEVGAIRSVARGGKSAVLTVEAVRVLEGSKVGDSIAVNGVCLTVTSMASCQFTADPPQFFGKAYKRQQSKSGKGYGGGRTFWRAHCIRAY